MQLKNTLKRHEGLSLKPYKDSVGKLTIGYGRNLDDRGISIEEADCLLNNDIMSALDDCRLNFKWFDSLSIGKQEALVNMCFNLGITRLKGFKKMLAALEVGDYIRASREALDSKWAKQVGSRAEEIAAALRGG